MKIKSTLLIILFSIPLLGMDVSETYSDTKECQKGDLYLLDDEEREQLKVINTLFQDVDEICSWNEMYGLNSYEKCQNFKDRLVALNETTSNLNSEIENLNSLNKKWVPLFKCRNSLRFDAKAFKNKSDDVLKQINNNFNSIKTCANDINYNLRLNCNTQNKVVPLPMKKTNMIDLNSDKSPFPKNPFPKYKEKKKVIIKPL